MVVHVNKEPDYAFRTVSKSDVLKVLEAIYKKRTNSDLKVTLAKSLNVAKFDWKEDVSVQPQDPLNLEDFEQIQVLEKTKNYIISKVRSKDSGDVYALTLAKKNEVPSGIFEASKHQFLTKLTEGFETEDGNGLFILMDYVDGGELSFHMGLATRFTEDQASKIYKSNQY
jgi:serine/threonine protein kinase